MPDRQRRFKRLKAETNKRSVLNSFSIISNDKTFVLKLSNFSHLKMYHAIFTAQM